MDIDHLRQWIGRGEEAADMVTHRLAVSLNATLNRAPDAMPLGLHWCLAPTLAATKDLAADGLPARGGFLPPVPLPLRMWAGGRLEFHDAFKVRDEVTRRSAVGDITVKEGRSGRLCFVAVTHDYLTVRGPAISERQDIVYRAATGSGAAPSAAVPRPEWTTHVMADAVLLFRYSALTFNAHRIHFDADY
jgi:3-methylfumaryl-CoA hydratase